MTVAPNSAPMTDADRRAAAAMERGSNSRIGRPGAER
jgi:hypothetical protein